MGIIGSRSKSIAEMIRRIIKRRQANIAWLDRYMPHYDRLVHYWLNGERKIPLDGFINLMTALRCEVIVVPLGNYGEWYRLNDFPDNDGNVLVMPDKVKKGPNIERGE